MSEVLLIHPPVSFNRLTKGGYDNIPPLGILYLAATLEKNDIPVRILDVLDASMTIEDIISYIGNNDIAVVGISATTPQIRTSMEIAKTIKSRFGDKIHIGIGNCHISADPSLIERYPYFDFGVTSEAEITFLEIVQRILRGERVRGVFEGVPVKNLDEIPFPAWHLVDMKKYVEKGMDFYPTLLTRGCPFQCVFCSRMGVSRVVRARSGKNVCDEIEQWIDQFNGRILFQDDSFTIKRRAVLDFCDEVIRRKLDIWWWAGGVRFDLIDKDLLDRMVKAGCAGFCLGIESGSERVRNEIVKKGVTDKEIFDGLKLISRYPIDIQISLVMGLPTETKDEMIQTANLPRKLLDAGFDNIAIAAITPTVPLPGAELFRQAIEEGIIDADIIDRYIRGELGDGFRDNWPIYVPKGVTKDELLEIRRKGYLAFYFSPKYLWKRLKSDILSYTRLKKDVSEAFSLIRSGRSRASFS